MTRPTFLIVSFDALRRDLLTSELAPNITAFMAAGADFPHSRSVFPTETRVNTASLSTGGRPSDHGIMANQFFDRMLSGAGTFNSADLSVLLEAERVYDGQVVTGPTLGETLNAHGLTFAALSTGTIGNARLLNPRARHIGQPTFSVQGPDVSSPVGGHDDVVARFGPVPPAAKPNLARCRYATDMLLGHFLAVHEPDVCVLWYSEPDIAYHYCGIGSAESIAATRLVDHEFGRILDWWQGSPERDRIQIVAISDHGQITARNKIDIVAEMRKAGFEVSGNLEADADYAVLPAYSGNILVRDGAAGLIEAMTRWLQDQPWCGLVFTEGRNEVEGVVAGSFSRALVGAQHMRSPHIYYTMRTDDAPNDHGIAGGCWFYSERIPIGGGLHGGLHPIELNNFMVARGSCFREGQAFEAPCGIIDLAPTILHCLGIDPPAGMSGRVLREALTGASDGGPNRAERKLSVGQGDYAQHLVFAEAGGIYLDGGWRADG
jgi:hypothetical protein